MVGRASALVIATLLVLFVLATHAAAFDPEPGNRAAPVVGRDLISGQTFSLEAQRGKWVLLYYWASW